MGARELLDKFNAAVGDLNKGTGYKDCIIKLNKDRSYIRVVMDDNTELIYIDESDAKKELSRRVAELTNAGAYVWEIARELNILESEVVRLQGRG